MNSKLFYVFVIVAIVSLCLMRWLTVRNQVAVDTDDICVELPSRNASTAQSIPFVYGRLGDGTGMSCLEFITADGDTMLLSKTSEYTGREAVMIGSVLPDLYNVYGVVITDNGESVGVMVNMTELRTAWCNQRGQGFVLNADNVAAPTGQSPAYLRWDLYQDNLVLTRTVMHEGGSTEASDTMQLLSLDADTLVLRNSFGDILKYGHP